MNALQFEKSPYLRQHATNPVDWMPWGDEAFDLARKYHKPVLVSIGYSACHWCHVMEHESFADPVTAAFMNDHFVNIKVDREERPDVDHFYMEAVQIITGSGGWPLNCFLTPERLPFFGGTYFPPEGRYGRPSWRQVLDKVHQIFHQNPDWIKDQSHRLLSAIGDQSAYLSAGKTLFAGEDMRPRLAQAARQLLKQVDHDFGGLGAAPKFPQCGVWQFLLAYYHFTEEKEALDAVELTVNKMYRGGIYDHLGGGFARYATDREWKIPHFEKMLYDNALLVMVMANLFKLTHKAIYRAIGQETLACINRDFSNDQGGFYSAFDADSEGVEGRYYVWELHELEEILGPEAAWFKQVYDLREQGNWEETNIIYLNTTTQLDDAGIVLPPGITREQWERAKQRLVAHRSKRTPPGMDDKCLAGWNALQIQAYFTAYQAWGDADNLRRAELGLQYLEENFLETETIRLWHLPKSYPQRIPAFLDDWAFYLQALLEAYQTTMKLAYLRLAITMTDQCLQEFYDPEQGLFFYQNKHSNNLPLRVQTVTDHSLPSGSAVMAGVCIRLFYLTGQASYMDTGQRVLASIRDSIIKYPASFGYYGVIWLAEAYGWKEVAMVGKHSQPEERLELLTNFLPELVMMASHEPLPEYPLLDKPASNEINIYFCQNFSCQKPVSNVKELMALF